MKLGEKDSSGRSKPIAIEGSEFAILCDTIIPAVGQEIDIEFVDQDLLKPIKNSFETKIPNVFIGGDALNGGLSVIAAIADGRKVAQIIIDKSGIDFDTKKVSERPKTDYKQLMIRKSKRIKAQHVNELDLNKRTDFSLISSSLGIEETINEANRCLLCDELCNICTTVCPNLAFFAYKSDPIRVVNKEGTAIFNLKQETQILHIADWCNMCGNCNTFCPTAGAPYEQKPHLYLNKSAFTEANEGYYFIYTDLEQSLLYKNNGEIHSFAENPINYSYITKAFSAEIEKQTFKIQNISYRNPEVKIELSKAIEMSIILEGARQFFGVNRNEK
jgi:putative selenate reductase